MTTPQVQKRITNISSHNVDIIFSLAIKKKFCDFSPNISPTYPENKLVVITWPKHTTKTVYIVLEMVTKMHLQIK